MKFIDGGENLFALNIPGTHDCATKYVWVPFISQCQDMDIHSQLDLGVRALDIRVQSKGKRLALVHGHDKCLNSPQLFKNQMDMADVLYQCYKFLEENEIQPQALLLIAEYCINKQGESVSPSYVFNKAKKFIKNYCFRNFMEAGTTNEIYQNI